METVMAEVRRRKIRVLALHGPMKEKQHYENLRFRPDRMRQNRNNETSIGVEK